MEVTLASSLLPTHHSVRSHLDIPSNFYKAHVTNILILISFSFSYLYFPRWLDGTPIDVTSDFSLMPL